VDLTAASPAHAALVALGAAVSRHDRARLDLDPGAAYGSLVECTWWVASLDEHLRDEPGYQKLREGDANGRFVTAMIWARDRHYHQLPFSIDHDDRPFIPAGGGPPFYISHGFEWRKSEDLWKDGAREVPAWRKAFDGLIAGKKTSEAPHRCLRWFESIAGDPYNYLPSSVSRFSRDPRTRRCP